MITKAVFLFNTLFALFIFKIIYDAAKNKG